MSQPYLIDQIVHVLCSNERTQVKRTPVMANKNLHPDAEGEEFDTEWEYQRLIGQLNFLEKSTCPEISYAADQYSRFSNRLISRNSYTANSEISNEYEECRHNNGTNNWCDADFSGDST